MVKLAVFPKCYMDDLCITRSMSLFQWIDVASELPVDGCELYDAFFLNFEDDYLQRVHDKLAQHQLQMPMMCYSPDFTLPDAAARQKEVEKQKQVMRVTAGLGGQFCRVLSGQRRPEVSHEQGVRWVVEALQTLVTYAEELGLTLTMENHYKDNYWTYPEFAQHSDTFTEILSHVPSPRLAVNYDPSNAIIAGEDPIEVLEKVKHRVVTMHASDRRLKAGYTLEDLRAQENAMGYASILIHGEIGTGMIDYDRIFFILREVGFDGWISVEDGVNGFAELERSAQFLRKKMIQYWPRAAAAWRSPVAAE